MIALAVMLLAAALAGWLALAGARWDVRSYARFACVLYGALAVGGAVSGELAQSITLMVSACAPVVLAFAVRFAFRGAVAAYLIALILIAVCIAGIVAAATGIAIFAFAPLLLSVLAILAISLRHIREQRWRAIQAIAAASALLAGASAFAAGGVRAEPALFLFSAAGLLGLSLALAPRSHAVVEQKCASGLRILSVRQPR